MNTRRKKIAILVGYVLTSLFLFYSLALLFSSLQWEIFLSLLVISYISIILFLILWNIKESRKVYLLLCIPVLCVAVGIIANIYFNKIKEIPTVSERGISFYRYEPFESGNLLKTLDEEYNFKIINNSPVLDGATALLPVYASFMQAVYLKENFNYTISKKHILCSGTDRAYRNLLEGRVDMIFCAEPSDLQMEQFYKNGIKLKLIPIGREAFVFFVNKENIVNDISIDNIRRIYSGKIKNWKKLNGKNQRIIAFQREKNSGSQTMLERTVGVPLKNPRRENVHGDMVGIINQVADYRNFSNAIGYSFLYFATEMVQNDQIKLLSINGIYPSRETIQNNTYPFSGNFYAIYIDSDNVNENIEPFIDWILSKQGQELISKTGYVKLKTD
jgi:phosphate transport system substrate-binding protein